VTLMYVIYVNVCIYPCSRMCLSIHASLHACMYGTVVIHCIDDYIYAHKPAQTH
jgi:hypothetical protein